MQLQPGERSILAYFPSQEAAANAVAQLKSIGFDEAHLSKISNYTRISSVTYSISALTYAGDDPEHYRSYAPLLASSPVVSGLSAHDTSYYTHMVTVISDDSQISQARTVIRECGGIA